MDLKRNILANIIGQGWTAAISLLVVPFYIKLLGIEGYGLVGFYLTLQAIFNSFLDFGLSVTITREIARYLVSPDRIHRLRDLVRTLEIGYWAIGILLGLLVILSAPWIAERWLTAESLSPETLRNVIVAMGISTIFQWPLSFYQGGLMGLQKMVFMNAISVGFTMFRALGAVLLLWLVSPNILLFFEWQIFSVVLQVFTIAFWVWRKLPLSDHRPRFEPAILKSVWRFAFGMSATSFVTFFLSEADRIILSKLLTLEFFGYYTLALTLSTGLQSMSAQIMKALFPSFSTLLAGGDDRELRGLYHRSSQLVTVITLPLSAIAALFAPELIRLWTQQPLVAMNTAPIAALLFIGSALNILVSIPYHLTLAYGWTSLGFIQNLISLIVIVPLMITLSTLFGGVGAALTLLLLNAGYLLITPAIIHRRILRGELRSWYLKDIGLPLIVVVTVAGIGRWLMPANLSDLTMIGVIAAIGVATFASAVFSAPEIRNSVLIRVSQFTGNRL